MTPEYQALLKQLAADIVPIVTAAAKAAVTDLNPVVGLVADPVIDAVDAYILKLLGGTPAANAVVASTETDDRVTALEKHVAALTVSTGNATAHNFVVAKASLADPPAKPTNAVADAVAAAMPSAQ